MSKYIEAEELLKQLSACKYPAQKTTKRQASYNAAISDVCRIIDTMPSSEIKPVKRGRWIVHTDKFVSGAEYFGYAVCSECGDMFNCMETIGIKPIWDYCPNCGAKMEAEEADG